MALKEGYKEIKVRLPMQELEVLNAKVAHSRMTREKYIRCLIAEKPPIEDLEGRGRAGERKTRRPCSRTGLQSLAQKL